MNREVKLKLWHVLACVISLTLLLYFVFIKITPTQVGDYTQQKQRIDSLNNVITGLESNQVKLNQSIFVQQLEIDILNKQIDSTSNEIIKVRKYYAKKIKDITTYTPTQLDNFFSERYQ
jgi:peptidoglycan hydrolase CwlO-like protein